jgi:hypothetical protein
MASVQNRFYWPDGRVSFYQMGTSSIVAMR